MGCTAGFMGLGFGPELAQRNLQSPSCDEVLPAVGWWPGPRGCPVGAAWPVCCCLAYSSPSLSNNDLTTFVSVLQMVWWIVCCHPVRVWLRCFLGMLTLTFAHPPGSCCWLTACREQRICVVSLCFKKNQVHTNHVSAFRSQHAAFKYEIVRCRRCDGPCGGAAAGRD